MPNIIDRLRNLVYGQPELTQSKQGLLHRIIRSSKPRISPEIDRLNQAIEIAESYIRPDRKYLYALYDLVKDDDEVESQMIVAKATLHNAPFVVYGPRNNERPDLVEYFNKQWFLEFLTHCLDTEFWGHSLLELDPTSMVRDEFTRLMLFPRVHVRPEYYDILPNTTDVVGIPYRDLSTGKAVSKYLIEIGQPFELGRFRKIARVFIRKNYADTDWSQYSERFGSPFLMVKTASRDKRELDAKEQMAANFGSNSYGIFDDQDELELLERKETNGHLVFLDRLKDARQQIAKMINGQSSTSDTKAFVGSAEVHERILNELTLSRLKTIQNTVNDALIPVLIEHGYPLRSCRFAFAELLKHDRTEGGGNSTGTKGDKTPPDDSGEAAPPDPPAKPGESKKKLNFSPDQTLHLLYKGVCCSTHTYSKLNYVSPAKAKRNAIAADIVANMPQAGQLHQGAFELFADKLLDAISQGAELDIRLLDAAHPQFALLTKLRNNAIQFSAAKTLTLLDEIGTASTPTLDQVRGHLSRHTGYLRAEYNMAVASTQQALLWKDYQANKDLYPMLRYSAVLDGRTRPEHRTLHGVTMPIDDPFWLSYYPPNGWNCRCIVQQVRRGVAAVPPAGAVGLDEVPAALRFNPGVEGRLFGDKHPYFKNQPQSGVLLDAISLIDVFNLHASPFGNPISAHITQTLPELIDNINAAAYLVDRHDIAGTLISNHPIITSSDFLTESGTLLEFKTSIGTESSIKKRIRIGLGQKPDSIWLFTKATNNDALFRVINGQVVDSLKNVPDVKTKFILVTIDFDETLAYAIENKKLTQISLESALAAHRER